MGRENPDNCTFELETFDMLGAISVKIGYNIVINATADDIVIHRRSTNNFSFYPGIGIDDESDDEFDDSDSDNDFSSEEPSADDEDPD